MTVVNSPPASLLSQRGAAETIYMATEFLHRTSRDGTIDSLCPRCYATVGNAHWEADLERMEDDHICDPTWIWLASPDEDDGAAAKEPQRIESSQKVQPIRRVS